MKKKLLREATADEAWLRKYPERMVLVVSIDEKDRPNIITLGWNMPPSHTPPMALISVGMTRHRHNLIQARKEFVHIFPSMELEQAVRDCGTHSGIDMAQFKETGLTPIPAKHVKPPLIEEGVVNMACKVVGEFRTGDHTVFVGEIVIASLFHAPVTVLFNGGPDEHGRRRFRGF